MKNINTMGNTKYIDRPFSRILVLYDKTTTDYPGKYILRWHVKNEDGHSYRPSSYCVMFDSVTEARNGVPAGLNDIGRDFNDDPVILACFI